MAADKKSLGKTTVKKPLVNIPPKVQDAIVALANGYQEKFNSDLSQFTDKLEAIDRAYFTVKDPESSAANDNPEVALVRANVESGVAYLADTYLSGYPLFGVVAPPDKTSVGVKFEALIDDHATRGRWDNEYLRLFADGMKYNICASEIAWEDITTLSYATNSGNLEATAKVEEVGEGINVVRTLDIYNTFWDYRVSPAKVASKGEFVGYNEIISKSALKELSITLNAKDRAYNISKAIKSTFKKDYFNTRPTVSIYEGGKGGEIDYVAFALGTDAVIEHGYHEAYMKTVLYVRLIPAMLDWKVQAVNTPQIWKFTVINNSVLLEAQRIISPQKLLPILMIDMEEDGFDIQSQSLGERTVPWQDVATELLSIRLNSGRRAISDRAIYDPHYISEADANTTTPAPKIPLKTSLHRDHKSLASAYMSIPYEGRGSDQALSDMRESMAMVDNLTGLNSSSRGQFRKGNRTLGEYDDVMDSAEGRLRLIAIRMNAQLFAPTKQIIKANVLMYASKATVMSRDTQELLEIDPAELRATIMEFKLADGFMPKSKFTNPEVVTAALQMLQLPQLQGIPPAVVLAMVSQIMALNGAKGLEPYMAIAMQAAQGQPAPAQPPTTASPDQAPVTERQA